MNKTHRLSLRIALFAVLMALLLSIVPAIVFAVEDTAPVADSPSVAKVGSVEYATIDEAIANWTSGSTLTLLSDVTLSDVIKLSSTEYHILDLGQYTMTAATSKDAIQIVNNGRSSASYALDIKADETNPGGITAKGKAVVRHSGSTKDRPITRFYGGVFNGSYIVHHSGNNGSNSPSFYFYGGEYNGTIYTNRSTNIFYGGVFNGSLQMSVDSSAYTLISGGTFSKLSNMMGSTLNSGKFTIGSAKGVYDREVYVDDNGNYVVAAAEPTEGIEAAVAKTPGTNDYFAYSKVATEGALKYTDVYTALKNNTSATVTVYADEIDFADLEDIKFKGTIVVPEGKTLTILNAPEGLKVEGNAVIKGNVAKIGEQKYETLADAIAAANAGDTITFLANISENVTVNRAITIDGAGFTYTGKMTVAGNAGADERVTFRNIKFLADTAVGNSVIVDLQRYAEAEFNGCNFTSNSTDTYYNSYKGITIANDCTVVIKDCTASKLYYMAHIAQGSKSLVVENCTLTEMVYGIGAFKCESVSVKNFTYHGMAAGINVKNSASTLALENVNITTTMNGQYPVAMWAPDSGVAAVKYTITLKGENFANGAEMLVESEADWFVRQNESNPYEIVDLNCLKGSGTKEDPYRIGSVEDLILFRDSVNAGETKYNAPGVYVVLIEDIDMAGATWERGIGDGINATFDGIFDGCGHTIKNLNLAPRADSEGYLCGGLFGYTYGAAVIKNLVLENVTVTTADAGHNVGVLVGFAYNKSGKLTVSGITLKNVTIDAPNAYGVGAIVGYSYYDMGTIENCSVQGATIRGYSFVGGIIGYSYSNATISGCSVQDATITATSYSAGGIVGIAQNGNKITGCTVENTTVIAQANFASVVGAISGNGNTLYIEDCTAAAPFVGGNYADNEVVTVKIGNKYYTTLAVAFEAANDGDTITLLRDIALDATIKNTKKVTLDLNGKTITGTDKATSGNFYLINNVGELTITGNGTITLVATTNRGWGGSSVVVANNPGGKLVVENGTIEHLGGSDMAYALDNLTNGVGTYAEMIINGGEIKSTYRAVRQFLNGAEAQNILTINGGTIEGANKAIFFHDPSTKANSGTLTIADTAVINGDIYLFVTAGSIEWPVEVSIAASAVNGEILTANVPELFELQNVNGNYVVHKHIYEAVVTPPTFTEQGYTTYTCPVCGDSYIADYVDAVPETTIRFTNMALNQNFTMSFAFPLNDVADWDGYYVVITQTTSDGTVVKSITLTTDSWKSRTIEGIRCIIVDYKGVTAKQMTDVLSATVYNADGVAVSAPKQNSIKDFVMQKLENTTDADAKFRTLLVDILNYGTEAQKIFGYAVDNLSNADLTDEQRAWASEAREYQKNYQKTWTEGYENKISMATKVVLGNNIELQFGFIISEEIELSENARLVVTYIDHNGNAERKEFSVDNYKGRIVVASIDSLNALDAGIVITCSLIDGDMTYASVTNSVESYVAGLSADKVGVGIALMKYCDSAVAYFNEQKSK